MRLWTAFAYAFLTSLHIPLMQRIKGRLDEKVPPKHWTQVLEQERRSVFANAVTALMLVGPLAAVLPKPEHVNPMFWLYISLAGVNQCLGLGAALTAYKRGDLSIVAPLATLTPVLAAPFTPILLGQRYTVLTTIGIVIVLAGAAFLDYKPTEGIRASVKGLAHNRAAQLYLLARIVWVPFPFLFKESTDSVTGGSPFFVSVFLLLTMAVATVPVSGRSWWILLYTFSERLPARSDTRQRVLAPRRLLWLYATGAMIMTMQQYSEVSAYRIGKNTIAVLVIFKLSIPLTLVWAHLFPRELKTNENDLPARSRKRLFWQRLITSAIMAGGAFLAGL